MEEELISGADPREREKVSVIPRFFASLAGFTVATFGLYIINGFNRMAGNENLYAEQGFTMFAIAIAIIPSQTYRKHIRDSNLPALSWIELHLHRHIGK